MEDLDCANCARKMEDAIRKIQGVESVSINFLTQKMTLEAQDDRSTRLCSRPRKPAAGRAGLPHPSLNEGERRKGRV